MNFLDHLIQHMQQQVKFIEDTIGQTPDVIFIHPDILLKISREPSFFEHPAFRTEVRATAPVISKIRLRRDLVIPIVEDTSELFYHFEKSKF